MGVGPVEYHTIGLYAVTFLLSPNSFSKIFTFGRGLGVGWSREVRSGTIAIGKQGKPHVGTPFQNKSIDQTSDLILNIYLTMQHRSMTDRPKICLERLENKENFPIMPPTAASPHMADVVGKPENGYRIVAVQNRISKS